MRTFLTLVILGMSALAAAGQTHVEYAGGTAKEIKRGASGDIEITGDTELLFVTKKATVRIPYGQINLIEYGQQVGRRILLAITISPAFLLTKSRKHYLTVGYSDAEGHQQAMVFRVDKAGIRPTLVGLEAKTGLKVQYQDEEARKAGKG